MRSPLQRHLRFWSSHPLALNALLCGLVWLLYGSFGLRGYGDQYLARTRDLWLEQGWPDVPGLENVLLPVLAAAFSWIWTAIGFEFTRTTFVLFAAAPYAIFIYGLTAHVRRWKPGGPVLAVAAAVALYSSGMIPYMTSWGGSVDGLAYLAMLPVFVWPNSLVVYGVSAVLQCLNHYAGLIALVLFAFVWHTLRAADHERPRDAMAYWGATFVPRAVLGGAILLAFMWYWDAAYPEAARVRQAIVVDKWRDPAAVLREVTGPFPWTLLSTLKLTFVPIIMLMGVPHPRTAIRRVALITPLVAAMVITLVFVDVTRMAMLMLMPLWLAMVGAAGGAFVIAPAARRRLRHVLLGTAVLSLLIPNYYVNNGDIHVPPSTALRTLVSTLVD